MKYITTFTILLISIQATAQIFPKQICVGSVVSLKAGDSISKSPFSCSPISIAKIDASGDIHGLAPGVVTIFYKNIKGVQATSSITVLPLPSTITGDLNLLAGSVTTLSNAAEGKWSSNDTNVFVDSKKGIVQVIHKVNSAPITFTDAANGCAITTTVNIVSAIPELKVSKDSLCKGESIQLTPPIQGGKWSVSDTTILSVNKIGLLKGIGVGTADLSYSLSDLTPTYKCFVILPAPSQINGTKSLLVGATETLTNTVGSGKWSSSDDKIATIDKNSGLLSALTQGTVIITNKLDNNCYISATFNCISLTQHILDSIAKSQNYIGRLLDSIESKYEQPRIAGKLKYNKYILDTNGLLPLYSDKKNFPINDTAGASKKYAFKPDTITIHTYFNRICDLVVTGDIVDRNKPTEIFYRRVAFSNLRHSLGFRELNHDCNPFFINYDTFLGKKNFFGLLNYKKFKHNKLWLNPNFVTYEPTSGAFSYIVANTEVQLSSGDSIEKVYKRSLYDYLSLQIFVDPLGFWNGTASSIGQFEGTANVPFNYKTSGSLNFLSQVNAELDYNYSNTATQTTRYAKIVSLTDGAGNNVNLINNLDLIRNYYYMFNLRVSAISWEMKVFNSYLHLETGFRLWGSNVGKTADSLQTLHRFFFEFVHITWETKPDQPFGFNLSAGVGQMDHLRMGSNIILSSNQPEFAYTNSFLIPHEINFYCKLSDNNKGGLFFKYLGFLEINSQNRFSTNLNAIYNAGGSLDYFPLILIGYSTNLSTLVKGGFPKNINALK